MSYPTTFLSKSYDNLGSFIKEDYDDQQQNEQIQDDVKRLESVITALLAGQKSLVEVQKQLTARIKTLEQQQFHSLNKKENADSDPNSNGFVHMISSVSDLCLKTLSVVETSQQENNYLIEAMNSELLSSSICANCLESTADENVTLDEMNKSLLTAVVYERQPNYELINQIQNLRIKLKAATPTKKIDELESFKRQILKRNQAFEENRLAKSEEIKINVIEILLETLQCCEEVFVTKKKFQKEISKNAEEVDLFDSFLVRTFGDKEEIFREDCVTSLEKDKKKFEKKFEKERLKRRKIFEMTVLPQNNQKECKEAGYEKIGDGFVLVHNDYNNSSVEEKSEEYEGFQVISDKEPTNDRKVEKIAAMFGGTVRRKYG